MVAVENRYQREYENKLDPFQSFSQAERKRKYAGLSVAEKVMTIQYYYENAENDHDTGDDEGDAVAGAVHREQQACAAAGDAVLGAAARAGVRGPVQAGQHRVLQARHGRQVAREVHRAHAGHTTHVLLQGSTLSQS